MLSTAAEWLSQLDRSSDSKDITNSLQAKVARWLNETPETFFCRPRGLSAHPKEWPVLSVFISLHTRWTLQSICILHVNQWYIWYYWYKIHVKLCCSRKLVAVELLVLPAHLGVSRWLHPAKAFLLPLFWYLNLGCPIGLLVKLVGSRPDILQPRVKRIANTCH